MKKRLMDVSVRSILFMMAYYITNSVFQGFMSLYYVDRGLDNTQIGSINSMIALVSVFSMQLWGAVGDRARSRRRLLCFMSLAAAAIMLFARVSDRFVWLLPVACAFASFYTSLQPMGDAIILSSLAEENRPFGPVRMAGGLSFALMSVIFGRALGAVSDSRVVVYAVSALCVGTGAAALFLPSGRENANKAGKTENAEKAGGMLTLFRDRDLLHLFLLMIPLQITLGYFYAFFSPMFKNDLPGGNETLLGWCFFISSVSEVPFLLNADRLFEKYGAGRLMCVSALTLGLRWLIVASAGHAYVAMMSQILHFWGFIVITVTLSKYVQVTVPENRKASGQLLISVFGFGVARVVGYFGGGVLSDRIGRQMVFYLCAAVCLICFAVFAPYYFRRAPVNGHGRNN